MQGWEIALLPIAAIAIAVYGIIRRRYEGYPAGRHAGELVCEVTFLDRQKTLGFIEPYFEDAQIEVLKLERHIESGENIDLYTNVYTLRLPKTVDHAELVSHISGCETVQSVHTRPV